MSEDWKYSLYCRLANSTYLCYDACGEILRGQGECIIYHNYCEAKPVLYASDQVLFDASLVMV